jgi:hypothetical protein
MSTFVAFAGPRALTTGAPADIALAIRRALNAGETAPVLIFDAVTSHPLELDLRGSEAEILARLAPASPPAEPDPAPARGRPKLGVTAREVTLLPRHWDWLAQQCGGASAALRRLVEDASRLDAAPAALRRSKEALYRFITHMAGDAPGYEEATRALFAGDAARFTAHSAAWPADVRAHALALAPAAFGAVPVAGSSA